MKIPKYIDKLLEKRAKSALDFTEADSKIAEQLEKNEVEVSGDHILSGACSLYEPYTSIDCIRQAILEK